MRIILEYKDEKVYELVTNLSVRYYLNQILDDKYRSIIFYTNREIRCYKVYNTDGTINNKDILVNDLKYFLTPRNIIIYDDIDTILKKYFPKEYRKDKLKKIYKYLVD